MYFVRSTLLLTISHILFLNRYIYVKYLEKMQRRPIYQLFTGAAGAAGVVVCAICGVLMIGEAVILGVRVIC